MVKQKKIKRLGLILGLVGLLGLLVTVVFPKVAEASTNKSIHIVKVWQTQHLTKSEATATPKTAVTSINGTVDTQTGQLATYCDPQLTQASGTTVAKAQTSLVVDQVAQQDGQAVAYHISTSSNKAPNTWVSANEVTYSENLLNIK